MALVQVAVEGTTDQVVAHKLCEIAGLEASDTYICGGKPNLDRRLPGYNAAAAHSAWFVMRDLDTDEACAPSLKQRLLPRPGTHMCFRIVVRSLEAWLMGDRKGIARYFGVPVTRVPDSPERIQHPKAAFVDLARRSSRRIIREEIVPRAGSVVTVGPGYTGHVIEFVGNIWDPRAAACRCPSLKRCMQALAALH